MKTKTNSNKPPYLSGILTYSSFIEVLGIILSNNEFCMYIIEMSEEIKKKNKMC